MIAIKGVFEWRGLSLKLAQKQLNNIARESIVDTAAHHHSDNIPIRFTYHGSKRLGMPERSPAYTRSKFKRMGHGNPNVWTGESKRAALSSPNITGRATSKGASAKISINAPRLNFRNPKSKNRVHPLSDVRAIPAIEAEGLTRFMDQRVDHYLGVFGARAAARRISIGAFV